MSENNNLKISKFNIQYPDGIESQQAEIYIPIKAVAGLNEIINELKFPSKPGVVNQNFGSFKDYEDLVNVFNMSGEEIKSFIKPGSSIYIEKSEVPDLWVKEILGLAEEYVYTSDEQFLEDIKNEVQVSYYILAEQEGQKATAVSVNGVYQSLWDADTKLDKITYTGNYDQAYIKYYNGTQGMGNISPGTPLPRSIVQRTDDGDVIVPDVPVRTNGAVSKSYVDTNFLPKPNSESNCLIGWANDTGIQIKQYTNHLPMSERFCTAISVDSAAGNTAPTLGGTFLVPDPTKLYHAANKKYVDNGFVPKYTNTGSLNRAYMAKAGSAGDGTVEISQSADSNTLVQRTSNGNIKASAPVENNDLTTKQYVDENFTPKTQAATESNLGLVKSAKSYGFVVTSVGAPSADTLSLSEYTNASAAAFIGKGTLQNIIGLVEGTIIIDGESFIKRVPAYLKNEPEAYIGACCLADEVRHVLMGYDYDNDEFVVYDMSDETSTMMGDYEIQ